MGCCQSADSAKKDGVENTPTPQSPQQTKNVHSQSKTPKPMTTKGGSVKNQVHPTVETLVTEETPFDGYNAPKKVAVDFTPQKEVLQNERGGNLQQTSPHQTHAMEEFESPQTITESPPSFMKKPKVYLKPLPLDKLKKNGDQNAASSYIMLQPLKPLPLNILKEESQAHKTGVAEIEKTSKNKVVINSITTSILEPDTMQASANFLPKFGINVCDEEQDPRVVISHQNGTVEDSDSECDQQDNHEDGAQYDQQLPSQHKPVISNNDSAIFSKTPIKGLKQPLDSERAQNNKKTAETYVNGLLNKIWESQENTKRQMDIGGDINPVIAVEDDVVEFPGNHQRLGHKLITFKESNKAAQEDSNQAEQPVIKNGEQIILSGQTSHNQDHLVKTHPKLNLMRDVGSQELNSDQTASHRPNQHAFLAPKFFGGNSPKFPNEDNLLNGGEDGAHGNDMTMMTDRQFVEQGIIREAEGRLFIEDSFSFPQQQDGGSQVPLSLRQNHNEAAGIGNFGDDINKVTALSHRFESLSKKNNELSSFRKAQQPSFKDFSSQKAGVDDNQDFFLVAGEEELNSFISHGSKHDTVVQRI